MFAMQWSQCAQNKQENQANDSVDRWLSGINDKLDQNTLNKYWACQKVLSKAGFENK